MQATKNGLTTTTSEMVEAANKRSSEQANNILPPSKPAGGNVGKGGSGRSEFNPNFRNPNMLMSSKSSGSCPVSIATIIFTNHLMVMHDGDGQWSGE
jgi:hypothetical protein